jgi:hypothetical protein
MKKQNSNGNNKAVAAKGGRDVNFERKKENMRRAVARLHATTLHDPVYLEKLAMNIVDPADSELMLFPSPTPGRAGVARFPLVTEHTGDASFGIVVKPDLNEPLLISSNTVIAEGVTTVSGACKTSSASQSVNGEAFSFEGDSNSCSLGSQTQGGKQCIPLTSAGAAVFTWNLEVAKAKAPLNVSLLTYDGTVWTSLSTVTDVGMGVTEATKTSIVFAATITHFTFQTISTSGSPFTSSAELTFRLIPTTGTWSCDILGTNETVQAVHSPEWAALKAIAPEMRIVAMSCLVTYRGSTLNNSGMIAVCNADQTLSITDSYYDTVSRRPFDMYDGRLASAGETEGGAHWHYVADSPNSLLLSNEPDQNDNRMVGYFGVAGMNTGESVRIKADIIVNYFTTDPSYAMHYQPPFAGFSSLLHELRVNVPLVSSNDGHLDKILKVAKRLSKRAVTHALDNPDDVLKAIASIAAMIV